MRVPEIILIKTVNQFLDYLTADAESVVDESQSLIYQLFYNDDNGERIVLSSNDWYVQAKSILLRNSENPRRLEINMGYNLNRINSPTIHILLPSQNKGRIDSINQDESELFLNEGDDETLYNTKEISFSTMYNLMITSENISEVNIIYYALHYLFVAFHDHFEISGFLNLKCSGQDVNVQNDMVPPNIYHKNFLISFDFLSKFTIKTNYTLVSGIKFEGCKQTNIDTNLTNEIYQPLTNEDGQNLTI
jgi:hypothetical protein